MSGKHAEHHRRLYDETERAFWRLNDWTHGRPGFAARNTAYSWSCECGACFQIDNAPPGYSGRFIVIATVPKGVAPCSLVAEAIATSLEDLRGVPDDRMDYAIDRALIEARGKEAEQTLGAFCDQVAEQRRQAKEGKA
jgi:hypothetical protein